MVAPRMKQPTLEVEIVQASYLQFLVLQILGCHGSDSPDCFVGSLMRDYEVAVDICIQVRAFAIIYQ